MTREEYLEKKKWWVKLIASDKNRPLPKLTEKGLKNMLKFM